MSRTVYWAKTREGAALLAEMSRRGLIVESRPSPVRSLGTLAREFPPSPMQSLNALAHEPPKINALYVERHRNAATGHYSTEAAAKASPREHVKERDRYWWAY